MDFETKNLTVKVTVETKAKQDWKTQYQIMWYNKPKNMRRNIQQIRKIVSQAKIYASLYL
jgi:hypothetical protein